MTWRIRVGGETRTWSRLRFQARGSLLVGVLVTLLPVSNGCLKREGQAVPEARVAREWLGRAQATDGEGLTELMDELVSMGPSSATVLSALVNSSRREVSQAAEGALEDLSPEAVLVLRSQLSSPEREVRLWGAVALGRIGDLGAPASGALVATLGDASRSGDDELASELTNALRSVGPRCLDAVAEGWKRDAAREPLEGVLWHYSLISLPYLEALRGEVGSGDLSDLEDLIWSIKTEGLRAPERTDGGRNADGGGILAWTMVSETSLPPSDALELGIETLSVGEAVTRLIRLAGEGDPIQRRQAVRALGHFGEGAEPAVELLTEFLGVRDLHLRWASVDALGAIGEGAREAVPELVRLADGDWSWATRRKAAWALGEIGPAASAAVPTLAAMYQDEEEKPGDLEGATGRRLAACRALALVAPAEAPAILAAGLGDSKWEIRRASAEAMALCGASALPILGTGVSADVPRVRRAAAFALCRLGTREDLAWEILSGVEDGGDPFLEWARAEAEDRLERLLSSP